MDPIPNRRSAGRVKFERGINVQVMAIDGTWRRECVMHDVSETGAQLTIAGGVEKLNLKEFFLVLSSTGLAFRRCGLAWINGEQIGANFLKKTDSNTKAGKPPVVDGRVPQ
jgi:hypothetical protein